MLKYSAHVFMQCFVAVICYTKPDTICKSRDDNCFTNVGRGIMKAAISGDSKLGIRSLDPIHLNLVEGNLPTVKYTLKNVKARGVKDVVVNEIKFVPPNTISIDLLFPKYTMNGEYEIQGKLMCTAVEGKGKIFMNATNIHVLIDTTEEIYIKDGVQYLKLNISKVRSELEGVMHLDFENLFNGNKQLSDPVLKFVNDNYKIVAKLLQSPLTTSNMIKIIENANVILSQVPLRDLTELK